MEEKGFKLFGVRIVDGERLKREQEMEMRDLKREAMEKTMTKGMLKSQSMMNLGPCSSISSGYHGAGDDGFLSDGGLSKSSRRREGQERKRGVPWTEEEHQTFLAGLEKLGRGDWRGISRNFVMTRTPTQVASHAQKYFLRQSNPNKKKRRSSLFDVVIRNKDPGHPTFTFISTIVAQDQQPPTNLLKLSVSSDTPQTLVNLATTTATNDLELSIAPPQSQSNLSTLSPGTIRVV